MNGRLYDAKLHRFLQPDNYVQDPSNTQNYNRYGYVLNNPLKYTDPSGEFFFVAMIVGAIIGAYIGGSKANDNWNPLKWDYSSGKTWLGIGTGAVIGAIGGEIVGAGLAGAQAFGIFGVTLSSGVAVPGIGTLGIYKSGEYYGSQFTNQQGQTFNQSIGTVPVVKPNSDSADNSDFKNWSSNLKSGVGMTLDWAFGSGKDHREFRNTSEANAFRNSNVINQVRNYWYKEVNSGNKSINDGVSNFRGEQAWTGGNFGLSGIMKAGFDPMEQFVGSFAPEIKSDGMTLTYTLKNTTSMKSLLYGLAPDWLRSTWRPRGNMTPNIYIY